MAAVKTLSPFVNRSSRYFWRIRMIDNAKYGTRTISSIKYKSASDTVQLRPTLTSSMLVPVEDDNKSREHIQAQKKIWEEATRFEEDQADKFIPVTRQVLVKTLSKERSLLSVDEREKIERFSAALDSYISQQFYTQLDKMKVTHIIDQWWMVHTCFLLLLHLSLWLIRIIIYFTVVIMLVVIDKDNFLFH